MLLSWKRIEVKEDNAIIYRSCGCSSRLVNKAFVCPEFYDSLKEEKLSSRRGKTSFLI